jgi:protein TonB
LPNSRAGIGSNWRRSGNRITAEGKAGAIHVLKAAPFDLTAQAIKAVQQWKFKPAQKDGKPISVRTPVETTFRLF